MLGIVIFGNSSSGKSTLAKHLAEQYNLAHLDLDTIAWLPTPEPTRQAVEVSQLQIEQFIDREKNWVIEGCYGDLLALVSNHASTLVFLDLPITQCLDHAKSRPWEPHKYSSKEAQDANLPMLLDWIEAYKQRRDTFSYQAHLALYQQHQGDKIRFTEPVSLSDNRFIQIATKSY